MREGEGENGRELEFAGGRAKSGNAAAAATISKVLSECNPPASARVPSVLAGKREAGPLEQPPLACDVGRPLLNASGLRKSPTKPPLK